MKQKKNNLRKIKYAMAKISENFKKELDDIKLSRIKGGIDKDLISNSRLTEALTKDYDFPKIKERLIKMPRIEDIK